MFQEHLPQEFLDRYELLDVVQTIQQMHAPSSIAQQSRAQYRIMFDKMLKIQLHSLMSKEQYQSVALPQTLISRDEAIKQTLTPLIQSLPYQLTTAQKRVITEMIHDMHDPSGKPMLRLLQ